MTNGAAERVLDALGDPTRRAILTALRSGPLSVQVLADRLPVSRPAVSQHLRVLSDARLVVHRRDGTRRLYRLDPEGLAIVRAWLASFWAGGLANLAHLAEQEERS